MQIMIQLRMDIALELQNEYNHPKNTAKRKPETEQLLNTLTKFGLRILPVNPGQTNPLLASDFIIETKDRETAEQIIKYLQQFEEIILASYFRPDNELP